MMQHTRCQAMNVAGLEYPTLKEMSDFSLYDLNSRVSVAGQEHVKQKSHKKKKGQIDKPGVPGATASGAVKCKSYGHGHVQVSLHF